MEKTQDDVTKMFDVTIECMLRNAGVWGENAIIQEILDDMTQSRIVVRERYVIQLKGHGDDTLAKNEDRDLLVSSVIKVKSGIIAYCNNVKDHSNFHYINRTNSEIKGMKDDELKAYSNNVNKYAKDIVEKLIPYNIILTDVSLLKSRYDTFIEVTQKTRYTEAEITEATQFIEVELNRITGRLKNELDPLVETYLDAAPEFVSKYHTSRKVVHYGVRHKNPEATIIFSAVDSDTKLPLRLVHILVVETEDIALTDDLGAATIKLAKAGVYTITYTKPGYEVLTKTNVELGVGDVLKLEAELVKIV